MSLGTDAGDGVDARGARMQLLVTRRGGTGLDPIRLELFNKRFMSVAEQMGVALERTASMDVVIATDRRGSEGLDSELAGEEVT